MPSTCRALLLPAKAFQDILFPDNPRFRRCQRLIYKITRLFSREFPGPGWGFEVTRADGAGRWASGSRATREVEAQTSGEEGE